MNPSFQRLAGNQLDELLSLMQELYRDTGMPWSPSVARRSVEDLLGHPDRGGAWIIRLRDDAVGYFVLTLAFSLEFGGVFALLDEFYVVPPWRSHGIGSQTLRFVEEQCRRFGAATLRLETGVANQDAIRFYERHGLRREPRCLMTKRLG